VKIGFKSKDRIPELVDLVKELITKIGVEKDKPTRLLNIDQAASFLGVEKQTLYKWVCQRSIPFVKCGRLTRFDIKELNVWIAKSTFKDIDFSQRFND